MPTGTLTLAQIDQILNGFPWDDWSVRELLRRHAVGQHDRFSVGVVARDDAACRSVH